jgi:dynamin 1-like protein
LLLKLVTTFVADFQEAIQGNQRLESTSSELFGGARINQIFNEIYVEMINAISSTDDLSPADVRNAIRNSSGPRPALFVPEASFEVLTKRQIGKLEVPAQRCVDLVYEELQRLANRVERKEIQRFPVLAEKLVQATNDLLRERLVPTAEMVESLVKIEMAYINTNHPDFWKSGSAISTLAKIIEEKRRKETGQLAISYSKSNEELLNSTSSPVSPATVPIKPINANNGKDEGGLLSYLFRAPNPPPYSRSMHGEGKRPTQPQPKAAPKTIEMSSLPSPPLDDYSVDSLNEKEEVETRLIVSLIHSYFGIVKKNLIDSVPKATMHFLVNHTVEQLPTKLVTELYREDLIDELLKEDEDVVKQRMRCKAALEAYRQAATLLSQVKDADFSKLKK